MAVPGSGADQDIQEAGAGVAGPSPASATVRGADGEPVALPSSAFISDGAFQRNGNDLTIETSDGAQVVVEGYFAANPLPDLVSPDGSQILTPSLLESFLAPMAPGQYAQAAPMAVAAPIGQILDLEGQAVAVRADGSRVQLSKGDPVYEGDVVETGGGDSAIRMVFTDKTEFSLGTDARLALDQLIFNPDTQSGSAQFSVLKGVFIFASGQIAKSDNTDMTVSTPVATIGIRGTEVAGRVADGDSQFTIIDGSIEVTTRAGSVTLDGRGETTQVAGNDTMPSDPVVLNPAQFGQAYGEVSGVVSGYFGPSQPGAPGSNPGGGGAPSGPDGGQPDQSDPSTGDRADAGMAPGGMMLASTLPTDTPTVAGLSDPLALATAFASDPVASAPVLQTAPFASGLAGPVGAPNAAIPGITNTGAGRPGSESGGGQETVISVIPGLDLADGITFGAPGAQSGGASGFNLGPTVADGIAGGADPDLVQVSFSEVGGAPDGVISGGAVSVPPGAEDTAPAGSPPLDVPSTGSSGSPFRSDGGGPDPFAGNPYVSQPFGYAGPQLGDAIFDLVSGSSQGDDAGGEIVADDPNTAGVTVDTGASQGNTQVPAETLEISLVISNAASNGQTQDLTHSFTLPNLGPGSSIQVGGGSIPLPGVDDSAQIDLVRDANGNVAVELASAWDSVKNIRAESNVAGDIRIENFVHADVHFGGAGASDITLIGAKRGFVTTGDGNDRVTVDAVSNGDGWSNRFDLRTGGGDDLVVFEGASNGLSELYFDGGTGTDTVHLTGPGQSFDLTSGQVQFVGVERVDISGAGDATITVSGDLFDGLAEFTNALTDTANTLVIDGDAGDTVDLQGDDWTPLSDPVEIDGQSYAVYEHAEGMRVAADSDLQIA